MKKIFLMLTIFTLFFAIGPIATYAFDLEGVDYTVETPYFHYAGNAYPLDIDFEDMDGTHIIDVEVYRIDHTGEKVEILDSDTLTIVNESVNYNYDFPENADYPYQVEAEETVIRKGYVKPWDAERLENDFHNNYDPGTTPKVHIGPTIYNEGAEHDVDDYDFNIAPDEYPAMHYAAFDGRAADHFVRFSVNGDDNFNGLDINVNAVNEQFGDYGFIILPTDPGWEDFIDPDLHSWYEEEILTHTMETILIQDPEGTVDTYPMYPEYFTPAYLEEAILYLNGDGGDMVSDHPNINSYYHAPENDVYYMQGDNGGQVLLKYDNEPGEVEFLETGGPLDNGDVIELRFTEMAGNVSFEPDNVYDYAYYNRGELLYDYNEPLVLDDYDHVIDLTLNDTEFRPGDALKATLSVPNSGVRETYNFYSTPSNSTWISDMLEDGSATWTKTAESDGSYSISVDMVADSLYRDDEFSISADYETEAPPTLNERIDTWLGGNGDEDAEFFKLMIGLALIVIITIGLSLIRAGLPAILIADVVTLMALIALGFIPSWLIIILGLGSIGLIFIIAFHYYGGVNG